MRAALSLPYGFLPGYTRDPLGDLAAGRCDAPLRAAYEEAGLRPGEGQIDFGTVSRNLSP